eukprot:TRINITY_DN23868_c0_g1_i1.p1 TRINITY_DN23868_c0_g1~~TRINITY_DN23868_c0_g1_i1.p1  ORF type:complete len:178 (+),score=26.83 TRINITY_DN23868_c0_g1_i1:61-534(+)
MWRSCPGPFLQGVPAAGAEGAAVTPQGPTAVSSHEDFLFARDRIHSAPSNVGSSFLEHDTHASSSSEMHGGLHASGPPEHGMEHVRLAESGLSIAVGLHSAKTAVLMAGGMCSKLFGLGMMATMAYQSVKQARASQEQQGQQGQQGWPQRRGTPPGA